MKRWYRKSGVANWATLPTLSTKAQDLFAYIE
jgi:hypothetical protein